MLLPLLRAIGRQRLINRGKVGLLHRLTRRGKPLSRRFTADFFGLRYSGDIANWIDWNVYFLGAYEPEFLALLDDVTDIIRRERGSVHYVDVGANIGHHALFMSRLADQVTAFEPFPRVAAEIDRKAAENSLTSLRLFKVGLGDEDADLPMELPDSGNLGTASFVLGQPGSAGRERSMLGTLPVRRGDDLFEREGLPRIDILKVDVQGFEAKVFAGLRNRILTDRPVILTELSGDDLSGFGSEDALRAALYPDHMIYAVAAQRGRCELRPFSPHAPDLLCLPNELLPRLQRWRHDGRD